MPSLIRCAVALLFLLTSSATAQITVKSDGKQVVFSAADLAKLKRHDVRILAEGSTDSATVSGVKLWDVLQLAGIPAIEASGRQRAVMYLRIAGADGQNAVIALVEIDPGFSQRMVLVADRRNGKPLEGVEGPWRVFIPDEARHARWIRGLVTVELAVVKP